MNGSADERPDHSAECATRQGTARCNCDWFTRFLAWEHAHGIHKETQKYCRQCGDQSPVGQDLQ